jgi:hypothetical protein
MGGQLVVPEAHGLHLILHFGVGVGQPLHCLGMRSLPCCIQPALMLVS